MDKLNGVEDTLFIPLVGRIYSSKCYKEFFYDEKALELEKYIKDDLIKENTGEYFTLASISRFYELDRLAAAFIQKYKACNIISLGCGLETMYFRLRDKRATYYEIDFPSVIEQRRIALGENENEVLIGSNILDFSWIDKIDTKRPSLIIASGVFQYLHHADVISIINQIKARFSVAELAFDATNKSGIKGAEKYVKKTGNTSAMMYFYIGSIEKFVKESNTTLIRKIPFYKNATRILKGKLKLSTRVTCFFGDRLGFTKLLYLKIK